MATLDKDELEQLWQAKKTDLVNAITTPLYLTDIDDLTNAQIIAIAAQVQGLDEFYETIKANLLNKKTPQIETGELIHLYSKARANYVTVLYKELSIQNKDYSNKKMQILIASGKLKALKAFRDSVKTYLDNKTS